MWKKRSIPGICSGEIDICYPAKKSFIAWLSGETAVHAYPMPGRRFDIGNLESYRTVQETYKGIEKA